MQSWNTSSRLPCCYHIVPIIISPLDLCRSPNPIRPSTVCSLASSSLVQYNSLKSPSGICQIIIYCPNPALVPCFTQFSSIAQSCPTLCDPMDCSMPGLPVHHQLLEFTQTHVRRVGDAIQPSHPLSSPSPPAFSLYQHQGLFQ